MEHIQVAFELPSAESGEILLALLMDIGYEGFEENTGSLKAFIPAERYDAAELEAVANTVGVPYVTESIQQQNWNAIWESSFEPVIVDDFCTIRAHFHTVTSTTPYEIIITPKMSFGTGHHATTQLMMMAMKDIDFNGKSVLDFGSGTGVLAILAAMLGATDITGIDNDEWAVENAIENAERNLVPGIAMLQASLEQLPQRTYDILLANINRHILLEHMQGLYQRLAGGGILLMSGLLIADEPIIAEAALEAGFQVDHVAERSGWISIRCSKC